MSPDQVRDTLASLDGRLDDVRREQAWRAIERDLDAPIAPRRENLGWRRPIAYALAAVAIVTAFFVIQRPSATPAIPATELSAAPGQRTVFDRDGVTLTLLGPASASVAGDRDGTVHVRIINGTVVADRTAAAPGLTIIAGGNTTVTHDRRFAVRVEPAMVVLGAGDRAREIVERHGFELGPAAPPPSPLSTPVPSVPAIAPEPAPTPPPSSSPTRAPRIAAEPPAAESSTEREPPKLPVIIVSAAELYRRAEASLAIRDPQGARTLLEQLIRDYPTDPRVDAARYDLALLARAGGDRPHALVLLDQILSAGTDADVQRAARRLRDQIQPPK